jgi:hypothetical protein
MLPSISRLIQARWPRITLDVAFCLGFVVLFMLMVTHGSSSTFALSGQAVELSLSEGAQRQGLFRGTDRIGTVVWSIKRREPGWLVTHSIELGRDRAARRSGATNVNVTARTKLTLRGDLSLSRLSLDADLSQLGKLSGLSFPALPGIGRLDELRIRLQGDCAMETGDCHLVGAVGSHALNHVVTAGRGPVVTSAIYPLLARGSLGGTAEVRIFDPMTLSQRVVKFKVEGRERLRLKTGKAFDTLRVHRDLEGLGTRVWIDDKGRVLKEELPLGLTAEHEAWERE